MALHNTEFGENHLGKITDPTLAQKVFLEAVEKVGNELMRPFIF